jgi:hypothetical protein
MHAGGGEIDRRIKGEKKSRVMWTHHPALCRSKQVRTTVTII